MRVLLIMYAQQQAYPGMQGAAAAAYGQQMNPAMPQQQQGQQGQFPQQQQMQQPQMYGQQQYPGMGQMGGMGMGMGMGMPMGMGMGMGMGVPGMGMMGQAAGAGNMRGGDTTMRKIFVGGLPYHTDDVALKECFTKHGEIEEAVVIMDRTTGKSKGYGFVCRVLSFIVWIMLLAYFRSVSIGYEWLFPIRALVLVLWGLFVAG